MDYVYEPGLYESQVIYLLFMLHLSLSLWHHAQCLALTVQDVFVK